MYLIQPVLFLFWVGDAMTTEYIAALITDGRIQDFYRHREWRRMRFKVLLKYHNECQECKRQKRYSKATVVHHVKHLEGFPELALSETYTENGMEHAQLLPLCRNCHELVHGRTVGCIKDKPKSNQFINVERW